MTKELLNEIEEYWTDRAPGYSKVNQDELHGTQKANWTRLLIEQIEMVYPDRQNKDIHILDVGTGPGFFSVIMAEAGYRMTAVDYTEAMLIQARENAGQYAQNIEFLQMDAQNLTFEDDTFDVVISRNLTWNLEHPDKAYASWCRVLKKNGLLLNFDANWYGYLYDEKERMKYEQDRANVEASGIEDHYTCTDIDTMENIAMQMPLSKRTRPEWDAQVFKGLQVAAFACERDMGSKVWSEIEQLNYAATPMFMIKVRK